MSTANMGKNLTMGAGDRAPVSQRRAMWLDLALAASAAFAYILIALGVLAVGDLALDERPPAIIAVAAGCYLLGGLLILARRRWLWIVGAVINTLVLLFFFGMYQDRPAVLFSPGGLVSKGAQLLLEIGLIYLIITDWHRPRRRA